jgi:hypothetical protein
MDDCRGKPVPTGLTGCRNIDDASNVCELPLHIRSALLDYFGYDTCNYACWRRRTNLISDNAQLVPLTR